MNIQDVYSQGAVEGYTRELLGTKVLASQKTFPLYIKHAWALGLQPNLRTQETVTLEVRCKSIPLPKAAAKKAAAKATAKHALKPKADPAPKAETRPKPGKRGKK